MGRKSQTPTVGWRIPTLTKTMAWVEAQNKITREYIDRSPVRQELEARLTELWNYPKYGPPRKKGDRYFFSKNDGLQNQAVLYMVQELEGEPIEIIDPNRLSEDGTTAITNQAFSEDGTLLAYGLSQSGSDWQEIRIRRIDRGDDFDEVIQWAKFAGIAWKHDNSGFFYNRFPTPGTVPPEDQNNYSRVYWHRLGSPQEEDVLTFEMPKKKELGFQPFITNDGAYLVLYRPITAPTTETGSTFARWRTTQTSSACWKWENRSTNLLAALARRSTSSPISKRHEGVSSPSIWRTLTAATG